MGLDGLRWDWGSWGKTVGMGEMSWGGTGWFGVRPIVLLYDGLVQVQYSKKLKTM